MEDVLPEGYSQKDYENDLYAFTVTSRRMGPGDKEAAERAAKKIMLWEQQEKEREAKLLKEENDARDRKRRLMEEVNASMPDVYEEAEFEKDKSEVEELSKLEDRDADKIDFLRIRMGRYVLRKQKEKQAVINEQRKQESIKAAEAQLKQKKILAAKIRAKNKRAGEFNRKQVKKNNEIHNIINAFIETIKEEDIVYEYRNMMGEADCKNPEFIRGFLSAIDKIISFDLGKKPYLPYKEYEDEHI